MNREGRSPFRTLLAALCWTLAAAGPDLRAAGTFADGSSEAVGTAEARRLYETANAYLSNVTEAGEYSYAYMQFYWKGAQENLDRILRVYPSTPTGQGLRSGALKAGPFELEYFRERALPRLEEKRSYAVDYVTTAAFLYRLDPDRWDETRRRTMELIVEVLARQERWGEAFDFQPVLAEDGERRTQAIFRVAARQGHAIVDQMLLDALPAQQKALFAIQGEAHALRGLPREELARFLDAHPEPEVKLAVLNGMALREAQIQRAAALRLKPDPTSGIGLAHYRLLNLDVRDDLEAVARTFFPAGHPAAAALLATYRAALGNRPGPGAPAEAHPAYIEHLGALERFDEVDAHLAGLNPSLRTPAELKAIEALALAGRGPEAARRATALAAREPARADDAQLALFVGRVNSSAALFEARPATFAELPIRDPLVLAQALMEWRLVPAGQRIRGASPYDAVIRKFLPGFENLPLPEIREPEPAAAPRRAN